jgi:hypothetical protein
LLLPQSLIDRGVDDAAPLAEWEKLLKVIDIIVMVEAHSVKHKQPFLPGL